MYIERSTSAHDKYKMTWKKMNYVLSPMLFAFNFENPWQKFYEHQEHHSQIHIKFHKQLGAVNSIDSIISLFTAASMVCFATHRNLN